MKLSLTNPTSGYNLQTINANFDAIETEFQSKVLYRDNPTGEPNQMENDLDMNSNRIFNLPAPLNQTEPVRLRELDQLMLNYIARSDSDHISVRDFTGIVGDGIADDYVYLQQAIDFATLLGKALYFPSGNYRTSTTLNVTRLWQFYGDGPSSIVSTTANIPLFTFNINTTSIQGWEIRDLMFVGPVSSNTASCALRFIGDATAFVQYGKCKVTSVNFNAFLKNEKLGRTTSFGLENMLNWNIWDNIVLNPNTYGYWHTTGSGTGNQWSGTIMTLSAGAIGIAFEGSGYVVGDIIVQGQFGCQNVSGGVGVRIGDNTVYRAQIDISKAQFDANVNIPLQLSSTGSTKYTNIYYGGNNNGGLTTLGAGLQPLRNSIVEDRDVDFRLAGKAVTNNSTGAQSTNVFTITTSAYGAYKFRVSANGLVGGVTACSSYAEYEVRDTAGVLTVTQLESYVGATNCFDFTVTPSGSVLTVAVTYTPTSTGTLFNTTIKATGHDFKIARA